MSKRIRLAAAVFAMALSFSFAAGVSGAKAAPKPIPGHITPDASMVGWAW